MVDPSSLNETLGAAAAVSNSPIMACIDRMFGYRFSEWSAKGEIRKREVIEEYESAKKDGISGVTRIEALRGTQNMLNTIVKSSEYIEDGKENNIEMDNDFFWNTVSHSRFVSNSEVQDLIASIIAGEFNSPGSYSMSTLQTLKMLGKEELKKFEVIMSLSINCYDIPIDVFSLPDDLQPVLKRLDLDYGSLQSLQCLGLFLPNEMSRSYTNCEEGFFVKYFDETLKFIQVGKKQKSFSSPGFYSLSPTGIQIIKHLKPKKDEEYLEWLKKNYKIGGFKLDSL